MSANTPEDASTQAVIDRAAAAFLDAVSGKPNIFRALVAPLSPPEQLAVISRAAERRVGHVPAETMTKARRAMARDFYRLLMQARS